jgi:putative Mg2+ transporter-C (MgtC) family protein
VSNPEQLELFWRLLLALALGGIIGLEREYRGHEAGVRTNALVCAGAALFGTVSLHLGDTRVAAAVVQGVGFLGAGLIFQRGPDVKGVTTAASVWLLAGVGLLVANDLWLTAVLMTFVMLMLLEFSPVSDRILRIGFRRRGERPPPSADDYEEAP